MFALLGSAILVASVLWFISRYAISLQNPFQIQLRWPMVISERAASEEAERARADQHGQQLSAWQQYACTKFGPECRVALAIQRAENPQGKCEVYHYNADGTLDWGYFQINTIHLKRPGLNLRDLLDCKANIDFAYQLFQEKGSFAPWSTYNSGNIVNLWNLIECQMENIAWAKSLLADAPYADRGRILGQSVPERTRRAGGARGRLQADDATQASRSSGPGSGMPEESTQEHHTAAPRSRFSANGLSQRRRIK
jgi:hypothetical protein